ncbi:MAG: Pseudouridine synthase [candidate division CPR2 bacterium GW2011_GWC1_41_48]|uniref:Pseudouridine synthase n=1 Tax=candidate division CPR2 bacterium GW2011_GWC1_41_48 TaxID=1618344 RepID=A0A0G0W9Z4_UNCC2|nr:MAG: Pseudouridine synthase [candidate division CPR2 bacterium GW2011_GWC2_39_35]KKS08872.1 MAG: Pseudouridine synthase [candidate division CPR2 bacterium GW2011_GWC1_41_48]
MHKMSGLTKEFKVSVSESGERLDRFLVFKLPEYSRSFVVRLIEGGSILVDGESKKPSHILKEGNIIAVKSLDEEKDGKEIKPLKSSLDIIYEDEGILVINKPAGLVVHPAVGHEEDTLVNVLAFLRPNLKKIDSSRFGIVHRLDKETSGIMVVAKTPKSLKSLSDQIQGRKIKKHYKAIVFGHLDSKKGKVEVPIKRLISERKKMGVSVVGRKSVTEFEVGQEFAHTSLVNAFPITGRTHQIRVHLAFIGHPIVGDKLYSSRNKQKEAEDMGVMRHMLHAFRLGITNPSTLKWQEFEAQLPEDFRKTLDKLK